MAQAPVASTVEFITEKQTIQAGEPFAVAVILHHPDEWHSYYKNAGDSGFSPSFEWELPEGFTISEEPVWPTPHLYETGGLISYVYEGSPAFEFTVTPPATLPHTEVSLSVKPSWLLCKEQCIQEPPFGKEFVETLTLSVGEAAKFNQDTRSKFQELRLAQPKVAEEARFPIFTNEGVYYLLLPVGDTVATFFEADGNLALGGGESLEIDGRYFLKLEKGRYAPKNLETLSGILVQDDTYFHQLNQSPIRPWSELATFIGKEGAAVSTTTSTPMNTSDTANEKTNPVIFTLFFMFLGGLILNLMPCVFPVIGIKVMSFANQAGGSKKATVEHSLYFVLGVLVSFWLLAGTLYVLRLSLGDAIGWGFQLQNPWTVWGMIILFLLLGLNMAGVFELGTTLTSAGNLEHKTSGKFATILSGALTTIVATPCSGPFLGAAIGATFEMSGILFFISFTMMALGLAFPYLLLAIKPEWVNLMPRPGRWMEALKQGLSFFLFASVAFLIWVYLSLQLETAHLATLISLVAMAFASWIWGRYTTPAQSKKTRWIGIVVSLYILGTAAWLSSPKSEAESETNLVWETWSAEKVEASLAEGKPVFIDFTAKWCTTCQINKSIAYTDEVKSLIAKHDVVLYKADKTKPSPEIEKALIALGRTAIPVNVLYTETGAEPQITPETLNGAILSDFLRKHLEAEE